MTVTSDTLKRLFPIESMNTGHCEILMPLPSANSASKHAVAHRHWFNGADRSMYFALASVSFTGELNRYHTIQRLISLPNTACGQDS